MINLVNQNILIIAAHPDDEILGCGGLLNKVSNKSKVSILFIGEGSSCRYSDLKSDCIKDDIKEREFAAKKAAEKFFVNDLESIITFLLCLGLQSDIPV